MYKYYSSTIQKGSQGDDVKEWQKFLQSQGYDFSEWGGPDGIFGDATDEYTRDWQQKNGIGVDGIVGETTWGKAGYTYLSPTAPTAPTYNTDATELPSIDTKPYDETTEGDKAKDAYETAKDKVNAHNKKGFTFSEQEWLNKIKESIENYGEFSYNFNEDALYQQAVDRYSQMGKMAMADTMGQAAAMTGGYGNSYAQSVGQQTYQNYLQEAHDMLPEFYQMALDRYQMGKDDLYNQYDMLLSEYEREYGLHSDEYQRLLDALGIASDAYYKGGEIYRAEQGIKNDAAWDEYNAKEAAREYANKLIQQGYENESKEWESNTENYRKYKTYDAPYGSSDNGSDNGGNKGVTPDGVEYDNGSVSTEDIKAMQEAIGVGADGYWGPKSTEAAGGLTADEAYEAWINGELGGESKVWNDFDQETLEANQKEAGGSYYDTALSALKEMNARGATYEEMMSYIQELVANSYISKDEYPTLLQWIRTTKNEDSNIHNQNRRYGVTR